MRRPGHTSKATHSPEAPARGPRGPSGPYAGGRAAAGGAGDRAPHRPGGGERRRGGPHRVAADAAERPLRGHRRVRRAGDRRQRRRQGRRRDRPRCRRARLRLRLRAPRGPDAPLGRRVHHASRRGRADLRRHAPRHRDALRRAAARHGRGHQREPRGDRGRLRRAGRPARRRRHEADRDHVREPRRAPGRELPEDDGGDGHRRQGDPDQAGRPPPQHAHARRAAEAKADVEGARDAGDLRAAGAPARDPRDQVGARGPGLRQAAPAQVRRDQAARRPAADRARDLRRGRGPVPGRGAEGRGDRGAHLRPRQALLFDLHEDDQEGPRVQRDLRSHGDARDRRLGQGLLRHDRRHPLDLEAAAGPLQGLRRDAQGQHVPGPAHDGDRARGQAAGDPDPHGRDARAGRVRRRHPRRLQGGRRQGRQGRPAAGEDDLAAPARRDRGRAGPGRVPRGAEGRPVRGRGLRLHARRARSRTSPPARRRSTSPTPSTRTSATAASGRR